MSVSIDGVAGGKVTARDRAASFASEGGAASLSLFFIDGVAGGKDTVRGRAASFASEGGAFYQRIQSCRIIKMVIFFTQKREARHQNGTD